MENIKKKRLECDLTLEEVARHISVSKQTAQKYESGVVLNIPSDKIEKMADLFHTTPAYLMGWDKSLGNVYAVAPDETNPQLQTPDEVTEIIKDLLSLPPDALTEIKGLIELVKIKYERAGK